MSPGFTGTTQKQRRSPHNESREDIMQKATDLLNMIPQEAFQKCFQQWQDRWKKCVPHQGDYFEGD